MSDVPTESQDQQRRSVLERFRSAQPGVHRGVGLQDKDLLLLSRLRDPRCCARLRSKLDRAGIGSVTKNQGYGNLRFHSHHESSRGFRHTGVPPRSIPRLSPPKGCAGLRHAAALSFVRFACWPVGGRFHVANVWRCLFRDRSSTRTRGDPHVASKGVARTCDVLRCRVTRADQLRCDHPHALASRDKFLLVAILWRCMKLVPRKKCFPIALQRLRSLACFCLRSRGGGSFSLSSVVALFLALRCGSSHRWWARCSFRS